MKKDTPFVVTEWTWFKLQLQIYSLNRRAKYWYTIFNYDDERGRLTCSIWCKTVSDLVRKKASKSEHLKYYPGWIEMEQRSILEILEELPVLKNEFDIERDIKFEILHDYGEGSSIVCAYIDGEFLWTNAAPSD